MKKLIIIFSILFTATFATGFEYVEKGFVYSPKIGETTEASIGDAMIEVQRGEFFKAFVMLEDSQPRGNKDDSDASSAIIKDSVWLVVGNQSNGDMICEREKDRYRSKFRMIVNKSGEIVGFIKNFIDEPQLWGQKPTILKQIDKHLVYLQLKQQLIYNGKSDKTIKISYREFSRDLVRPSFTQDMSYDLAESKLVGFKGLEIEVLKATNSSIKFIMRSPMSIDKANIE